MKDYLKPTVAKSTDLPKPPPKRKEVEGEQNDPFNREKTMKEWPKFKAGDRVWSALRNDWVELIEIGQHGLYDGGWMYDTDGKLSGSSGPFPMLFLNEVKPEDWPQPEPLPDLEVDTPVMVKDLGNSRWFKRHFAYWDDTKICCWDYGGTSFTSKSAAHWDQWRLPTEKEFKNNTRD